MPTADFKCSGCNRVVELDLKHFDPKRPWCAADTDICDGVMERIWTPVAIGGGGPGLSPARYPGVTK